MTQAASPLVDLLPEEVARWHDEGKLRVQPTRDLVTPADLAAAYTPGVARVCEVLAEDPSRVPELTIQGRTIAVVSDGSAVLGLGDIGPRASLPVMEGKAVLFKRFAGVDAWPVCLDAHGADEIVEAVAALAPTFGGINLEDIAAPVCFEVEDRLRERLDVPVFHDDQHGTAIVVLAALRNALQIVGKSLSEVSVLVLGAGAAGVAVTDALRKEGVGDIVVCDRRGVLREGRDDLTPVKRRIARETAPAPGLSTPDEAIAGADVLIGVSGARILEASQLEQMASDAIVFALANPTPEVDLDAARERVAVVASGRSGEPNQVNNVLAFPAVFRGLLDARATAVPERLVGTAATALADVLDDDERSAGCIIPDAFDSRVVPAVSDAVHDLVVASGLVRGR